MHRIVKKKEKYSLLIYPSRKWREYQYTLRELSNPRPRVRCNFSVNRFS